MDYMKLDVKEFEQLCPKCGKRFTVTGTQRDFDKGKLRKYCSIHCANSRQHSEETRQKTSKSIKKYYDTHEYSDKFIVPTKAYTCKYCGSQFTMKDIRDTGGRKYCCKECRDNWLRNNLYNKSGGCREGSGRSKSGRYKGIYCSSTWELAFVIYHLDHNLKIERCGECRTYFYNGKEHKYYPDFVTNDGVIEIKGINNEQWEAKHIANPDVRVLFESDIQPYLEYVHDRYTTNLIELYDDSKPSNDENRVYYWIHKGDEETMIKKELIDIYLKDGWIKGRLLRNINV